MNKQLLNIAHLIALMCLAHNFLCANGNRGASVTLKEVATLDRGNEFIKVGEIATDSRNYIYAADDYAYSVKKFSPSGVFEREFGKHGHHENEFSSFLFRMICSNDTFAISQLSDTRVRFFTLEGKFIQSLPLPGTVVDIAFDSRNRIFASVVPFSKNKEDVLALYEKTGRALSRVSLRHLSDNNIFNLVQLAVDGKDRLTVAYHFINMVELYDERLNRTKEFTIPGLPDIAPSITSKNEEIGSVPSGEIIKDVAVDSAGNIFVLEGDYAPHPSRDVVVMNRAGDLVASLILPSKTGFIYIDSKGYLYTREQERTIVKKYKLTYRGFH